MVARPEADSAVAARTVGSLISVQKPGRKHKILQIYRQLKFPELAVKRVNVLYGVNSGFFSTCLLGMSV